MDPRVADHEMGIELQIVELVEQRERARVQRRDADVRRIQDEIEALQLELARTAESLAGAPRSTQIDASRAGEHEPEPNSVRPA